MLKPTKEGMAEAITRLLSRPNISAPPTEDRLSENQCKELIDRVADIAILYGVTEGKALYEFSMSFWDGVTAYSEIIGRVFDSQLANKFASETMRKAMAAPSQT